MKNNDSKRPIVPNEPSAVNQNFKIINKFRNLWIIILVACLIVCTPVSFLLGRYFANSLDEQNENANKNEMKNGVWLDDDGEIRYYVDNEAVYAGLVRNTTGDYYYISSNGLKAVKNVTRNITFTNGLLPEGVYTFGSDGKLIFPTEFEPDAPEQDPGTEDNEDQPNEDDEALPPNNEDSVPDTESPNIKPEQKPDDSEGENTAPPPETPVKKAAITAKLIAPMVDGKVMLVSPGTQEYLSSDIRDEKNKTLRPTSWLTSAINFGVQLSPVLQISVENAAVACYKIELADNAQMENAAVEYIESNNIVSYSFEHLYVNTIYYYRVSAYTHENGVLMTEGTFTTADTPRALSVSGVYNLRDIGNWMTDSGKRVKQGLLLRGTEIDGAVEKQYSLTQEGLEDLLSIYHIKSDMDLRSKSDNSKDALGVSVMHKYYGMVMYATIFTPEGMIKIREVFSDLANPDNYPIYLHCTYGCDRTGTICYLLEALLGVSPDDCLKEYGLSNMPLENILSVEKGLEEFEGADLKEKTEAYLLSCGVTKEQIESIRNIFLGE